MGEFLKSPHEPSKGISADGAKYLQAVALAQQMGKTVEEVLAFMGITAPASVVAQTAKPEGEEEELPSLLKDKVLSLPPVEEETIPEDAKAKAVVSKKAVVSDETGFVVTEVIDPADASEADLARISEQEEQENNWDGKIREGSKVRVVHSAPGSRIKWTGKIGKVVRIIGNENAKVYEIEFKGQKIPKIRLNKKTGKLEKGYENKRLCTTFDTEDIELVD
jgi:hypothetical protein